MMNIKASIDTKRLQERLKEIKGIFEEQADELSKELAEEIKEKSDRMCPVDSGELKKSGYIKEIENGYEVGYSADHAIFAHEQPQSMRKNGESRFLYKAIIDTTGIYNEKLTERAIEKVKEGLKK